MTAGSLPDVALRWVAASVGRGHEVVAVRRLTGGISSEVHAVTTVDPAGSRHGHVLRRWLEPHVNGDDPTALVRQEVAVLRIAERVDVPTPQLMVADELGRAAGAPAILMTRLPGRLDLVPADPRDWTRQAAAALATIHDIPAEPAMPAWDPWRTTAVEVPPWTTRPDLWRAALALTATDEPHGRWTFVHHDFQQFNLLWSSGRLTGVVDWVSGSQGPPAWDVMHAYLNLCLLYSADRAEQFRHAYEAATGMDIHPWWHVYGLVEYLPGWGRFLQRQAGRRLRIDFTGMHDRVEAALEVALQRT